MKKRRWQTGFSLIEVMVVVVILAILAAIVVPKIMSRPDQAKMVKAKEDIRSIENALELYKLDNGIYPTEEQGLAALVKKPTAPPTPQNYAPGGYLRSMPIDPWGQPYRYNNPGKHGVIDVYTYGANNQPTGTGMNATIGNWNINQAQSANAS